MKKENLVIFERKIFSGPIFPSTSALGHIDALISFEDPGKFKYNVPLQWAQDLLQKSSELSAKDLRRNLSWTKIPPSWKPNFFALQYQNDSHRDDPEESYFPSEALHSELPPKLLQEKDWIDYPLREPENK